MNFKIFSLLLLFLWVNSTIAQLKVGDNPHQIDQASLIELESKEKAFVLSRVTNTQMLNIKPLAGALIYNTDNSCVYHYDGGK